MAHYLYKPHLLAPEFITTLELLVDRLYRATGDGPRVQLVGVPVDRIGSSPELQCDAAAITLIPAVFLIAAGAGALVSIGAEVVTDAGRSLRVSRFAWRHKYLDDHPGRIRLLSGSGAADDAALSLDSLLTLAELAQQAGGQSDNLPRGVMAYVPAVAMERQRQLPEVVCIRLADEETGRILEYRLSLIHTDSERRDARPQPRYAVGPQTGDVKHFI